jgi:hypothetical protein
MEEESWYAGIKIIAGARRCMQNKRLSDEKKEGKRVYVMSALARNELLTK